MDYLMYLKTFLLWFDHFLDPWAEICQIFWWFFGKFKNQKDILKLSDLYLNLLLALLADGFFLQISSTKIMEP